MIIPPKMQIERTMAPKTITFKAQKTLSIEFRFISTSPLLSLE